MSFFDAKIMTQTQIVSQILKIEKLIKKKREQDALSRYNTGEIVHEKQLEFHKCQKRNRWVFGGNRSGKTECGAVEAVWMARGIHPYRENRANVEGWVVSLSQGVQREVAQRKVLKYLNPDWIVDVTMSSGRADTPDRGIIDCITVKNVFGGLSRIVFKSCEMGRAKFQGASLDFVWFDEEPPEDIYYECLMRVADRKGDIFGTMTPLLGRTFVYDEIYLNNSGDPQTWYEFVEWEDNPYLDGEEIKRLTKALPAEELESRRFGRFASVKGMVYPEFDERVNVIEPFDVPHEWYDNISIDPGLRNPLSCHFYATDGENYYVIAEHYQEDRDVDYHCEKIKQICKRLNWPTGADGRISALIDSAAGQRTLASPKSVSDLFFERGIKVNPKVNKDVFAGVCKVKRLLRGDGDRPRLYVFSSCVNMIREFKGYKWGNDDSPVKTDDHAMDELRYYVMSQPPDKTAPTTVRQNPIQKDKRRLLRWIKRS